MEDVRKYRTWVLVERSQQIEGCWVAHCLDFDIVTQGHDFDDALRMIREAVNETVSNELNHDRDPRQLRAPESEWQRLYDLMDEAQQVPLNEIDNGEYSRAALRMWFSYRRVDASATEASHDGPAFVEMQDAA